MSESNNWKKFRATNGAPPCDLNDSVEVEYWDGTYKVALAKDIYWARRPHSLNKEVKEWRNLTDLDYTEDEYDYLRKVLENLHDLFGFAPAGELATLAEEILAEAINKMELIFENKRR